MCSRSPQNFKFSHFTLLLCQGRRRNVPKFITHVQGIVLLIKSYCFMTFPLPSPSYLLKLPKDLTEHRKPRRKSLWHPGYRLFKSRLTLIHEIKLIEVFISFGESGLKGYFNLKVKKYSKTKLRNKNLFKEPLLLSNLSRIKVRVNPGLAGPFVTS